MLADSLQKQEGRDVRGRFEKGQSGNPEGRFRKGRSGIPAGRLPGTRNKATQTAELLLDGEAEALTRKAVELALAGRRDCAAAVPRTHHSAPPRVSGAARQRAAGAAKIGDIGRQYQDGLELDFANASLAELLAWSMTQPARDPERPA